MMDSSAVLSNQTDQKEYRHRIWAWTMYDWANSAFATTILAAVLPVYFSQVAGASLPSPTIATSYWSIGLFISLFIVAVISPVLGTISDITRSKKRLLAIFAGIGIVSTALLILVSTGDWLLAGVLGILGRIGFSGSITFYDALLPHVAREEDRDSVSARGYAVGYLGGGLLLAINILMIQLLPGTWGARLSFVSVAIWWLVFSIPLFKAIPEPPAESKSLNSLKEIIAESFSRLAETMRSVRHYSELFKFLVSFLIYNDGIGTIIGIAAIYGAELGFGSVELILALLLVQFVGIPYSLIFGRLPNPVEKRRSFFLAFILLNLVSLPLVGILGARMLPVNLTGALENSMGALNPGRENNLVVIIGLLLGLELLLLGISMILRKPLNKVVGNFDTKNSIQLALVVYSAVAVWGYFLDSVIEFWFLAWMVAVVQGGSQALSRSLYASLSPAVKSGEFFGLFGIMEKVSTFIGPLLFAAAGLIFGSSRPAVLSLIVIFILGGLLLRRVDVSEGRKVAMMEDAKLLEGSQSA